MTTAIQKLRDAAKQVADATGEDFIYAAVEIKHNAGCEFKIYRGGRSHNAHTLEDATDKAIKWSEKADKLKRASDLRAQAEELEKEAA